MFPVNLRLDGRKVFLAGAGKVGRCKLNKLLKAGAQVLVVEPNPDQALLAMAAEGLIKLAAGFETGQLEGRNLAFAASSDHHLNQTVARAATERGVWVNVADAPELSDFILPAVVEDGDFQLSISTGGASPALAACMAADLREKFGPVYGRLTRLASLLRLVIMSSGLSLSEREAIFKRLFKSAELKSRLADRDMESALALIRELMHPVELNSDFDVNL